MSEVTRCTLGGRAGGSRPGADPLHGEVRHHQVLPGLADALEQPRHSRRHADAPAHQCRQVPGGDGPCNAERIARRLAARDDNAWVTEAATAYAAKRTGERASQVAPATEERNESGVEPAHTEKHAS